MKMIGGIVGLLAGAVLVLIGIINMGAADDAGQQIAAGLETVGVTVEGDDYMGAIAAKIEELRATEGADETMITALETMQTELQPHMDTLGSFMTWIYIAIVGGVIAVVLGFLTIKGKGVAMPALLTVVGVVLTVIAFIMVPGDPIHWIVAIVIAVGGALGAMGAKQSATA